MRFSFPSAAFRGKRGAAPAAPAVLTPAVLSLALALCAAGARGYTVSAGAYVCNPGASVTVPVSLDDAAGLAHISVRVNYDPQFLVFVRSRQGSLASVFPEGFSVSDNGAGSLLIASFAAAAAPAGAGGGSLALLTFSVREGTERLYSDLAIADVDIGDASGVRDLTAGGDAREIRTRNGMIRAFGEDDGAARLEAPQTVVAGTRLGTLALEPGDAIQAPGPGGGCVRVGRGVEAAGAIPVAAPDAGWPESGGVALLDAATPGLTFSLAGHASPSPEIVQTDLGGGMYRYALSPGGGGAAAPAVMSVDAGETFTAAQEAFIRSFAAGEAAPAGDIIVSGGAAAVDAARCLGIAPPAGQPDGAGNVRMSFTLPVLTITEFDVDAGDGGGVRLRAKVEPRGGMAIESAPLPAAIRLQGTPSLRTPMRDLPAGDVAIDAAGYLEEATKGRFDCAAPPGSNAFFRIRVQPPGE